MRLLNLLIFLIASPALASPVSIARSDILGCIGSGGTCLKPAKAAPYSESGKVVGWKVTHVKGMLAKLGLKENDVVVSANGEDVTDTKHMPHWVIELLRVKSLDLGVLRKGRPQTLKFQITD